MRHRLMRRRPPMALLLLLMRRLLPLRLLLRQLQRIDFSDSIQNIQMKRASDQFRRPFHLAIRRNG
jgi:hypothetical protein